MNPSALNAAAAEPAPKRLRRGLLALASVGLGTALLAWLLRGVDWAALGAQARAVGPAPWLGLAAGMVASHLLRAGRIRAEWQGRLDWSWRHAWALLVTHSAWVVLAPLRLGEGVYLWALRRQGIGLAHAAASLLKLRLQDAGILAALALLMWLPLPLPLRAAAAAAWLWLQMRGLPRWWARGRGQVLGIQTASTADGCSSWRSWFYAVSNWVVKLAALAWPLAALLGSDPVSALGAALGGEWGAALPLQPPAGLGPYEAGAWLGAQLAAHAQGTPPLAAGPVAAAALLVHVAAVLVTAACALLARLLGWTQLPPPSARPPAFPPASVPAPSTTALAAAPAAPSAARTALAPLPPQP